MQESFDQSTTSFPQESIDSALQSPLPAYIPVPRKKFPILVTVLLILLAFVAAISVYLFVQVKELNTQLTATPTPIPTPIASVDPYSSWKTYTNTSANYSVNYPSDWEMENQAAGSLPGVPSNSRFIEIYQPQEDKTISKGNIGFEEMGIIPESEAKLLTVTKDINGHVLDCQGNEGVNSKLWCWVKVPGQNKYLNIHIFTNEDEEINKVFYQILSTFRFNGATKEVINTCPESEWVDCMPGLDDEKKPQCSSEYLKWAEANCPGFQGAAL